MTATCLDETVYSRGRYTRLREMNQTSRTQENITTSNQLQRRLTQKTSPSTPLPLNPIDNATYGMDTINTANTTSTPRCNVSPYRTRFGCEIVKPPRYRD
ncbi:hypothetical protein LSAT2_023679 [Lamellibrachia satsuma]|nr:hypothetical protein LSAT2_023679 [Lamellibrachia satsuma]